MGRRTGASPSELLQALDVGFTSLGEDRQQQQQQQDDDEEDGEEEHRRQVGREGCDAEGPAAAFAATRGRLSRAPRHAAGHGAPLAMTATCNVPRRWVEDQALATWVYT